MEEQDRIEEVISDGTGNEMPIDVPEEKKAPPKPKKTRRKKKPRATGKTIPRRKPPIDKRAHGLLKGIENEKFELAEKPKPITGKFICTQKCYVWPKLYRPGDIAIFHEDQPAPQKDGKVICFDRAKPGVNVEPRPKMVKVTGIGDGG